MSQSDLPRALNFTPDDLAANREGHLSERQRERLRQNRRRAVVIGSALVVAFTFVATGLLFLGRQNASSILTLVGVGVTLCNMAMLGTFLRYWLRLGADLQGGRVDVVSGKAERIIRVTGRLTTYVLKIGDERIQVSRPTLKEFEHGASYRLYRTPYTRTLLSAEKA